MCAPPNSNPQSPAGGGSPRPRGGPAHTQPGAGFPLHSCESWRGGLCSPDSLAASLTCAGGEPAHQHPAPSPSGTPLGSPAESSPGAHSSDRHPCPPFSASVPIPTGASWDGPQMSCFPSLCQRLLLGEPGLRQHPPQGSPPPATVPTRVPCTLPIPISIPTGARPASTASNRRASMQSGVPRMLMGRMNE